MLCLFLLLLLFARESTGYNVYVNNITDESYDGLHCSPLSVDNNCNLRSAWSYCAYIIPEKCDIILPQMSVITISDANGPLYLSSNSNVDIYGNDSIVTNLVGSNNGSRFIASHETAHLNTSLGLSRYVCLYVQTKK